MAKKLESDEAVSPEVVSRDLAMDLLRVPHLHRLYVVKRFPPNAEKLITEWESIFKEYGIIDIKK